MKRKINKFKSLLLTVAASSVINWLFIIVFILGLGFKVFNYIGLIIIILFQWVELMLMAVNTHYYVEPASKEKEPVDKAKVMRELQDLYQQIESMQDVETKSIIEEFIKEKERQLGEALNG